MIGIFQSSFTRKRKNQTCLSKFLLCNRTADLSGKSVKVLKGKLNKSRRFFIIQLARKYYQWWYVFEIKIVFYSSQVIKPSFYITEHFVPAASQSAKTENCKTLKIEVDLWKISFFLGNFYLGRLIIWEVPFHLAGMGHLQSTTI